MSVGKNVGNMEQIDYSTLLDLANSFSDDGVINFNSLRSLLIGIVKTLMKNESGVLKINETQNLTQNKATAATNHCAMTAIKQPLVLNTATQCFIESAHDSKSRVLSSNAFNCITAMKAGEDFNFIQRSLDDTSISNAKNNLQSQNIKHFHQKHSQSSAKRNDEGLFIQPMLVNDYPTSMQCMDENSNAAKISKLHDNICVLTRASRNMFIEIERIEDFLLTKLSPDQQSFDDISGKFNPFASNLQLSSINHENVKNREEGKLR
jgi:hypothetical protein